MLRTIVRLVVALGYWGIAVLMAVENVVLPIPSELNLVHGPRRSRLSARRQLSARARVRAAGELDRARWLVAWGTVWLVRRRLAARRRSHA